MSTTKQLQHSQLGIHTNYTCKYDSSLLLSLERSAQRQSIGVMAPLPFQGCDIWNAYELSWLNAKGKPIVATASFTFPCTSPRLIESKSFKLYLNSYNSTHFPSLNAVYNTLSNDLSSAIGAPLQVNLTPLNQPTSMLENSFQGTCLDNLDIYINQYTVAPELLITTQKHTDETIYSNLLRSNCPVTNQPDWGSICIKYTGAAIDHAGLLSYLVSYRNHHEFHEHCIERIFMDIHRRCQPEKLTVYARYTRRGGLDINPYRSTETNNIPNNFKQIRQ